MAALPVGASRYGTASKRVRALAASEAAAAVTAGTGSVADAEVAQRISRRHSMPHAVLRQHSQDGATATARELGKALAALGCPVTTADARRIVTRFPGGTRSDSGEATANLHTYLSALGVPSSAAAAGAGSGGGHYHHHHHDPHHRPHLHHAHEAPRSASAGGGSTRFLAFDSDGVVVSPVGLRADRAVQARPRQSRSMSPRAASHRNLTTSVMFEGEVVCAAPATELGRGPKTGVLGGELGAAGGLTTYLGAPAEDGDDSGSGFASPSGRGVRQLLPAPHTAPRVVLSVASPPELFTVTRPGAGGPQQSLGSESHLRPDFTWRDAVEASVERSKRKVSVAAYTSAAVASLLTDGSAHRAGSASPPRPAAERSVAAAALAADASVPARQRSPPSQPAAGKEPLTMSPSRARAGAAAGMFARTTALPGWTLEESRAADALPASLVTAPVPAPGARNPAVLRSLATAAAYAPHDAEAATYTARLGEHIRRVVRAKLPAGDFAAGAALTSFLAREDGDRDGVIRDVDLWMRLRALAPEVTTEDVAHAVTCLGPVAHTPGLQPSGAAVGGATSDRDVSIEHFTDWVLRSVRDCPPPATGAAAAAAAGGAGSDLGSPSLWHDAGSGSGGVGAGGADERPTVAVDGGGGGGVPTSPLVPDMPATFAAIHSRRRQLRAAPHANKVHDSPTRPAMTNRLSWTSAAARYSAFRASWETKWGAPAKKELTADASRIADGPTWTTAAPAPFKILHLASPPPLSPLRAE